MTAMTLPHTNGTRPRMPIQPWLQSSVQKFFSAVNWEDNPEEVQEMKLTAMANPNAPLSLTLSVSRFFATVNWEGAEIAADPTPVAPPPTSAPANDFTLDDFSGLF